MLEAGSRKLTGQQSTAARTLSWNQLAWFGHFLGVWPILFGDSVFADWATAVSTLLFQGLNNFISFKRVSSIWHLTVCVTTEEREVKALSNSASAKQGLTQAPPKLGKHPWWWLNVSGNDPLFWGALRKVNLSGRCLLSNWNVLFWTGLWVWPFRLVSRVLRH